MAHENLLQDIYLFKEMSPQEISEINSIADVRSYAPGTDIFDQESKATALYVIKFGSVRIHQKSSSGDNIEVAVLGTGSHFGEMAFVDEEDRSATATAIEKSDVVKIEYQDLKAKLEENPSIAVKFYKALANFLCGRLRITTNDLSFARERNLRYF